MLKRAAKKMLGLAGFCVSRIGAVPPEPPIPTSTTGFLRELWPVKAGASLIRVGGDADGAYLIPDDLDGITALFSPGVDVKATFETQMAARGMTCYMADASVEAPPIDDPRFRFEPKYLGLRNTDGLVTLDAWVDEHEPGTHDLLLQMDIEGGEWAVLANASDAVLRRFRIVILELHTLSNLLDEFAHQTIIEVLRRLLETHHVVHNHPNNCGRLLHRHGLDVPDVLELTLLRKDRATPTGYAHSFPHPLDIKNCDECPDQPLPESWYAAA